jgi:ribosome-binding protein aMBF1 (putative translation factor)
MSPWELADMIEDVESLIEKAENAGMTQVARTLERALELLDEEVGKLRQQELDNTDDDNY